MNVQSFSERREGEGRNVADAWSSPENILSLMRLIAQGNFVKLANHPFARSKIISLRLKKSETGRAQYETGFIISDFVTTVVLERLDELRSASEQPQRISADVGAEKKRNIFGDVRLDALSGNKDLKRWSLLPQHYLNKLSIKELSRRYSYSVRQVQYELRFARDELARILFELEKQAGDTSIREHVYLCNKREGVWLLLADKEAMLNSMTTAYSAPCSAFLWGDWSVVVSKKAIIVPINKRVTVGFKPSVKNLECSIYQWSEDEEGWVFNEWHSAKMTRVVSESWLYLSSLDGIITSDHRPIEVLVFSDVPCGCGLHERTAISLCLAGCINSVFGLEDFDEHRIQQIAAILETFWYPQVSWAPIICSSCSPNSPRVMVFDRTADGGIDFQLVSAGDDEEIRKNRFLDRSAIKVDWIDFDITKLVPLSHRAITTDIDEVQKLYARSLGLICSVGFGCLAELLVNYILHLNYQKVGMMMNLHYDILSACGLSSSGFDARLNELRSKPKILGVKPSCCLTSDSALLALVDGSPPEATEDLASVVQPISSFLTPTPGLTRMF